MSKTKTQKLSMAASLMIVFLAFGAFAGAAAIVTKNQLSRAYHVGRRGEDDGGETKMMTRIRMMTRIKRIRKTKRM
jgi:hypothetical protein